MKVLGNGFVKMIDSMGDDDRIRFAARISHDGKGSNPLRNLLNYLTRHRHTSPSEHVVFTFHVKLPVFVARQLLRYRVGFSPNEVSGRYVDFSENDFYIPEESRLQKQATNTKQGSSDEVVRKPGNIRQFISDVTKSAVDAYQALLGNDLARELARSVLPTNMFTEVVITMNLNTLLHIVDQRARSDAQWEIQQYAKAFLEHAKTVAPVYVEEWEDNVFHAVTFTRAEQRAIRGLLIARPEGMRDSQWRELNEKVDEVRAA